MLEGHTGNATTIEIVRATENLSPTDFLGAALSPFTENLLL